MSLDKERLQQTAELAKLMREPRTVLGLIIERDQLTSENAGLKTGYEAYEQVVQGLKAEIERSATREILQLAEIEALRRGMKGDYDLDAWLEFATGSVQKDAERYRFMRHHSCVFRSGLPGHEPVSESDFDADCDAAMCKGERS